MSFVHASSPQFEAEATSKVTAFAANQELIVEQTRSGAVFASTDDEFAYLGAREHTPLAHSHFARLLIADARLAALRVLNAGQQPLRCSVFLAPDYPDRVAKPLVKKHADAVESMKSDGAPSRAAALSFLWTHVASGKAPDSRLGPVRICI